jgi:hypothetical protein
MAANAERSFADDNFAQNQSWTGGAEIFQFPISKGNRRPATTTTIWQLGPAVWEKELLPNIVMLADLKQGWDSYNAPAIRSDALVFALKLLQNIMQPGTPIPQVVPSSIGGVQLEWHERGIDLELHVTGPLEAELWYQDLARPDAEAISEDVTNDFSLVQSLVSELTSRRALIAHAV